MSGMIRTMKRIITLTLTAAMILTAVPTNAFAAETGDGDVFETQLPEAGEEVSEDLTAAAAEAEPGASLDEDAEVPTSFEEETEGEEGNEGSNETTDNATNEAA